jgi:mannose-6-phosphate isomerase-like protein (cupin superfamily)
MRHATSDGEIILETRHATGRRIATAGDREYLHLSIKPGGGIDPHVLNHPIEFYVLQGEGELLVDAERLPVTAGDLLTIPAGAERSWTNTDERRLELLGVKTIPYGGAH